jgi:AcrR family transcriptional regulator
MWYITGTRAKTPRTDTRARLLAATMDHVRAHGVGDLTLRQLAVALGTSHRMLVYHFGSKEGLLVEVIRAVEAEQVQALEALLADERLSPVDQLRQMWRRLTDPALDQNERLFFEVYAQALQGRPHTEVVLHAREAWIEPGAVIARRLGVPAQHSRAHARLWVAVTYGLLLDLLGTGDRTGVDDAMKQFLALYQR